MHVFVGGNGMAVMYFAKVNINSDIYNVYKKQSSADEILKILFSNIGSEHHPVKIDENEYVNFFDVKKDMNTRYVTGVLAKIFKDDIEIYDFSKNEILPFATKNVVKWAPFFFDFKNEIIAFTTAQSISRGNFIKYFKVLLDSYTEGIKFEIFLKTNSYELNEQIEKLDRVLEVDFTIVPPNSNEDEFNNLFPKNGDEIRETAATKIEQTLSTTKKDGSINMGASFLKRVMNAVSKGFGSIKIVGETDDQHKIHVTSSYETARKSFMPDKFKEDMQRFIDYAEGEIKKLIVDEQKVKD